MRGRTRRFGWDEAARLRSQGMSYRAVGDLLGVTDAAIYFALNPDSRARAARNSSEWIRSGTCPECGGPATRYSKSKQTRCRACYIKRQRALAIEQRTDALGRVHCSRCDTHRPVGFFRLNVAGHPAKWCRSCESASRRERRQRAASTVSWRSS